MNPSILSAHRRENVLHTVILIAAMAGLFALVGWVFLGRAGVQLALLFALVSAVFGPAVSPQLVLRMYRAQPISRAQAPQLYDTYDQLCRQANMTRPPALYYVPTRMLNAFAVGAGRKAAVAVTDGLLRTLNQRELAGVLAHELSHVRYRDTRIMALSDVFSRMTATVSQLASFGLMLAIPMLLTGGMALATFAKLILISLAHVPSFLLQMALSRSREFNADLGAVEITGDPEGLASALRKLERAQLGPWWQRIFRPHRTQNPVPAALRTHPATEERIARLLGVRGTNAEMAPATSSQPHSHRHLAPQTLPRIRVGPRWHVSGLWY